MTTWIIEPHDPFIARDGRPFASKPGTQAVTLSFPFPSTITGGVRTRNGLNSEGRFQIDQIEQVKEIEVRGPLLVELDPITGEISRWFAPTPSDALLLNLNPPDLLRGILKRLVPLKTAPHAITNLPEGLSIVGMKQPDSQKPHQNAPRYWNWQQFEKWLKDPIEEEKYLTELGHDGPLREKRTHVYIDSEKQTALEGALFQTQGLEFTLEDNRTRLALAVSTNAPNLKEGIAPLGGERRLVCWNRSNKSLPDYPQALKMNVLKYHSCRVILLTPAHFLEGYRPRWLLERREGVIPALQAIAIKGYKVVSGWDFEKNEPKPTRRLVPSGTTFFLTLEGDDKAIERWVDKIWMHCVSDGEQDRCDGFGLAVIGVWDGNLKTMEV